MLCILLTKDLILHEFERQGKFKFKIPRRIFYVLILILPEVRTYLIFVSRTKLLLCVFFLPSRASFFSFFFFFFLNIVGTKIFQFESETRWTLRIGRKEAEKSDSKQKKYKKRASLLFLLWELLVYKKKKKAGWKLYKG